MKNQMISEVERLNAELKALQPCKLEKEKAQKELSTAREEVQKLDQ